MMTHSKARYRLQAGILAGSLLIATGCKQFPSLTKETPQTTPAAAPAPAPRSDQDIATDVQSRISGQSALNGQNIQVGVNGGTVTLTGAVNNDASRALAAAESGGVNGVRTVINNLTVAPAEAAVKAPPAPPVERRRPRANRPSRPAANTEAMNQAPVGPPPPQETTPKAPPPPARPAAPVARTVSVASGTSLPVRLTDALDSNTTQTGQTIHGTLTADIIADNMVAIPRGTPVVGRVIQAKDATHFAGSSLLSIELTQISLPGRPLSVVTSPFSQEGKGRGKNTAMKTGGGAALGAIIGALAGGGKGAAIGAASGGGLGAGVNAVTRGEQVKIPAESLITFKLQSPVSVTTSRAASAPEGGTFDENGSDPNQPQ